VFLTKLWHLFYIAAAISGAIYVPLWLGQWWFPQFYREPIGWGHALLLFSVAFFPRLITWGIGEAIDRYRADKRRRRRRKT
jgi:hypothetical protein